MKGLIKFVLAVVVVTLLFIGYVNLTQTPPDKTDNSVTKTPDTSYAQEPDTPEAYDITLRCEDTTGVTMVSVDTVKGTVKAGKAFYKDGDTKVSPENGERGCDIVRVTESTILFGTEAVVGTCDAIKDSGGRGLFVAIDRLSGAMVTSLSIDDAKAGKGLFADTKPSLCQSAN
jgi:hypothetical protein